MTSLCSIGHFQVDDEHEGVEDLAKPRGACAQIYRPDSTTYARPPEKWTTDSPIRDKHEALASIANRERKKATRVMVQLRVASNDLEIICRVLPRVTIRESHQFESLISTISELVAEIRSQFQLGPGAIVPSQEDAVLQEDADSDDTLVDWRAINQQQWETGIRATHHEDGEPLQMWTHHLASDPILEDDYEVVFDD